MALGQFTSAKDLATKEGRWEARGHAACLPRWALRAMRHQRKVGQTSSEREVGND